MAGQMVSLVMLPRFSALSGADTFYTIPIDASQYVTAYLNIWRSPLVGTSPTFAVSCQESMDQINWSAPTAGSNITSYDPGADTEGLANPTLCKKWFRLKIVLGGTSPVATCWAVGFLEMRQPG